MFFGIFVLNRVLVLSIFVLNRVSFLRQEPITLFVDDKEPALMFYECLKLGIKNRNSVLNRVGKSAIFVLTAYEGPSRTSPPKDISSTPPPRAFLPHVCSRGWWTDGILSWELRDTFCENSLNNSDCWAFSRGETVPMSQPQYSKPRVIPANLWL